MLLQGFQECGDISYIRKLRKLFWHDDWMGDATFSQQFSVLFQIALGQVALVEDCCRGERNLSCVSPCLDGIVV